VLLQVVGELQAIAVPEQVPELLHTSFVVQEFPSSHDAPVLATHAWLDTTWQALQERVVQSWVPVLQYSFAAHCESRLQPTSEEALASEDPAALVFVTYNSIEVPTENDPPTPTEVKGPT